MGKKIYILTVSANIGTTVIINNKEYTVTGTPIKLKVKKGDPIDYIAKLEGYHSTQGWFSVSGSSILDLVLTPLPEVETISLFHCDDSEGTDEKKFAKSTTRALGIQVTGKFGASNTGVVEYANFQWDSVFGYHCWTVDYWLYPISDSNDHQIDVYLAGSNDNNSAIVRQETTSKGLSFYMSDSYKDILSNAQVSVTMRQWHHIAITYDSVYYKIYVDGILKYEVIGSIGTGKPFNYFGCGHGIIYTSRSRRDEIRISKSVRWTRNFTPPTSPE